MGPPPRMYGKSAKPAEELAYEEQLVKAVQALSVLEKQHKILVHDAETLTEKYLYTKRCALDVAWRFIPAESSEFTALPKVTPFHESGEAVAHYTLGALIGRGQYSTVNRCEDNAGRSFAIKRIHKEHIHSADGALRVEREGGNLPITPALTLN